ncbi:hypothetical protein ACFSUD_19425 [Sulfitobacter aestuarii]|uniref:Tyr recombinase domain-containing protein n=1 Tax=Sulfitobacter aestuarii TaxID=2161676 RepID=A0ABW5U8R3_9RHOB
MWAALFAEGNPLDDRGPLVHLRETSRKSLALRYGQWLCWLSLEKPCSLESPPPSRVTRPTLRQWLATLDRLAPMTRLMLAEAVLRVTMAAAPELDWSQETRLRAQLKAAAGRGKQTRKVGRVLSSAVLLEAGLNLAESAATSSGGPLFSATRMRDGAMIALLALVPMRRRALAGLALGSSVFVASDQILIAISSELDKMGIPWEAEVPPQVLPILRRYIDEARPFLASRGPGGLRNLWLDRKGNGLSYASIGPQIARQTSKMTGISVPPHFFRDAAATTLARISPQGAKLIRPVLGHRGFSTAQRHYNHAQTIEAGRDYATLIKKLKETRP